MVDDETRMLGYGMGMGMGMFPGMMGMGGMGYPYGMMGGNPYMYSGMVSILSIESVDFANDWQYGMGY